MDAMASSSSMAGSETRKLVAILAADVAGYSALMGKDEARTVRDLNAHFSVVVPMISEHGGRVIGTTGDGFLAEFASVIRALECALVIQAAMAERNSAVAADRRMRLRIGVNHGDVIYDRSGMYGDGINIAARLEALANLAAFASPARSTTRSAASSISPATILANPHSRTSFARCGYFACGRRGQRRRHRRLWQHLSSRPRAASCRRTGLRKLNRLAGLPAVPPQDCLRAARQAASFFCCLHIT